MAVSSALANIALGLITSVVGGAAVWLWQHLAVRRSRRAKESFFGLARDTGCLIIFNNAAGRRGAMHHDDVYAMIEVAALAASTGSPVSVESCNDFQGVNGSRTEFCLGGPGGGSNPRTGAHLAAHLPGVRTHVAGTRPLTYEIGGRIYSCSPGSEEFALVAKFTPYGSTRPVILICGQTALSNRAAISYLKREHRALARTLPDLRRFALMLQVTASDAFGHEAAALEADVTREAFAPRSRRLCPPGPALRQPRPAR